MEENTNVTTENATEGKTFTQDELNAKLQEILKEKEAKWQKKYSNYYSEDDLKSKTEELNTQLADLGNSLKEAEAKAAADAQTIADLEAKAKKHETDSVKIRIALDNGIPYELANKLTGDTAEEIEKDAKKMAKYIGKSVAPVRNAESSNETDGVLAAFKRMNPNINI